MIIFKKLTALFLLFVISCNDSSQSLNPKIDNTIYKTAIKFSKEKNWVYDASYYNISYPNGDVPSGGACTDVIIRVLREQGVDLQELIHNDMTRYFKNYPNLWGLTKPDPNIDHRRVSNIMCYFNRIGCNLPITNNLKDYKPGDIVTWSLGKATHIGIHLENGDVYHNIGPWAKIDKNFLFNHQIIGHYRL
jgi:uncharacterized protein YijF (DUF1287 family)